MGQKQYNIIKIDEEGYAVPNKEYWDSMCKKKYELNLRKSGIPEFYHNIEFLDYYGNMSKDNVHKLQAMLHNIYEPKFKDINLYLWGAEAGTQKTACACNFGKGCIKLGMQVKFMLFGSFVNYLMKLQGFHRDEEANDKINDLKNSDIIILDDCFDPNKSMLWKRESSRELIVSEIDTFFREHIYSKKRFVLTSNLSLDMVKQNYGLFLFELLDRNFVQLNFLDSIKEFRKERLGDNLWQ